MSDPEAAVVEYLVGVRLREVAKAEDYLAAEDLDLHVGDLVMVSTEGGQTVGEVRRPRRPLPDFKRDRPFPRVLRAATEAEGHEWRGRRGGGGRRPGATPRAGGRRAGSRARQRGGWG